jgi:hypothetical protein
MKIVVALAALGVHNTYGVLKKFATTKQQAVAVSYRGRDRGLPARIQVWSPLFKTDPDAAWYDNDNKTFGVYSKDRTETLAEALTWTAEQYGISEWATCPTDRLTKIPKSVRDAAEKAAKAVKPSTNQLTVYTWRGHRCHVGQTHEVCAAKSKAAVARAAGVKYVKQLDLTETGNEEDIKQALSDPGVIFWCPLDDRTHDWRRG